MAGLGTFTTPFPIEKADVFHSQESIARLIDSLVGTGVMGYEDLRITERASGGPNLSVDVTSGRAFIPQGPASGEHSSGLYGKRYTWQTTPSNSGVPGAANNAGGWLTTFNTPDPTNPRIDTVACKVFEHTYDGSNLYAAALVVKQGVATAGATLDNRLGASAPDLNEIPLADVLVSAAASTIPNANIRDRRPFAIPLHFLPPLLTDREITPLIPLGHPTVADQAIAHASHDTHQVAHAVWLPRRTRAKAFRWKYVQDSATALAGSFVLALYDGAGLRVARATGLTWSGATSAFVTRNDPINDPSEPTIEPGMYWLLFGLNSSAGSARVNGVKMDMAVAGSPGAAYPNLQLSRGSGGETAPDHLLTGFSDHFDVAAATVRPPLPLVALSNVWP